MEELLTQEYCYSTNMKLVIDWLKIEVWIYYMNLIIISGVILISRYQSKVVSKAEYEM
jgi:hypothetical protein